MRIFVSGDKRIEWSIIEVDVDAEDLGSTPGYCIYEYSTSPNLDGNCAFGIRFNECGPTYSSILQMIHELARTHPEKVRE